MSGYRETYESLCVLLEEYQGADPETVAEQILGMLGLLGEDTLSALDPPPGLQHWLISHGLSLVATTEATSPRVWEALQEDEEEEEPSGDLEGRQADVGPSLQVGDYVEYRTAPTGPHSQSQIGSGTVKNLAHDTVEVELSPGGAGIILFPEADFIRLVRSEPPSQSVQARPS